MKDTQMNNPFDVGKMCWMQIFFVNSVLNKITEVKKEMYICLAEQYMVCSLV
jgi:hypothetical protein